MNEQLEPYENPELYFYVRLTQSQLELLDDVVGHCSQDPAYLDRVRDLGDLGRLLRLAD